jgi:N-acyl homoserine lactone hydrolase
LERRLNGYLWQIYPLNLGEFKAIERSIFVLHSDLGTKIEAPCLGWLLHDGSEWILVDTGPWDPARAKEYHAYEMVGSGPDAVRRGLKDHGLEPNDILHVLLTHLHWDHVANVKLFENARFYVQHAEACYALDPLPPHRLAYEVGQSFVPPWHQILNRTTFFHGDEEFRPGITCHLLPGHTPGSQGILVQTERGKMMIAGDNVDLRENWEGDERHSHVPGGIFTNLEDYFGSLKRMEFLADAVLPAHDYCALDPAWQPWRS